MSTFSVPEELRYTSDHEWVRAEADGVYTIGITDYAQDALGDITYVDLPAVGTELAIQEAFGVVESVKAFSDIFAPVAGEVIEINEEAMEDPSLLHTGPYSDGWLVKIKASEDNPLEGLLGAEEYKTHMEG